MNRGLILKTMTASLAFGAVAMASAQIAWDNGPLMTHPSGGPGNAPRSELQTNLGLNVFGFGAQLAGATNNRVADDFIVPPHAKLLLSGVRFFTYQTTATAATITATNFQITTGATPGGTVVFGDTTTNRLTGNALTGLYRNTNTAPTDANRNIQTADAAITPIVLGPDTYWLDYQFSGSLASGPWAPPVTILGQTNKPGANAQQKIGTGAWAPLIDNGTAQAPQDLAWELRGRWALYSMGAGAGSVFGGFYAGGGDAELRNSDNTYFTIICDEANSTGEIRLSTQQPQGNGNAAAMTVTLESRSARSDITQFINLINDNNSAVNIDIRSTTISDQVVTVNINNPVTASSFVGPNGQIRAQIVYIPQADLDAADGWNLAIDQWEVIVTPAP